MVTTRRQPVVRTGVAPNLGREADRSFTERIGRGEPRRRGRPEVGGFSRLSRRTYVRGHLVDPLPRWRAVLYGKALLAEVIERDPSEFPAIRRNTCHRRIALPRIKHRFWGSRHSADASSPTRRIMPGWNEELATSKVRHRGLDTPYWFHRPNSFGELPERAQDRSTRTGLISRSRPAPQRKPESPRRSPPACALISDLLWPIAASSVT